MIKYIVKHSVKVSNNSTFEIFLGCALIQIPDVLFFIFDVLKKYLGYKSKDNESQ